MGKSAGGITKMLVVSVVLSILSQAGASAELMHEVAQLLKSFHGK
jgi:hypothetical protein